ncbi:hypothetical protein ACFYZ4_35855 [Streptomyces sp. NPDC001513]|uniref:hypothetical protein n=1 Tax=Streptomyces sp. NPDC001513 TaxID=3364580 RepID=UPI00368CE22D
MVSRSAAAGSRRHMSAAEASRAFALGRTLAASSVLGSGRRRPQQEAAWAPFAPGTPPSGAVTAEPAHGYEGLPHARSSTMATAATGWSTMQRTQSADGPV